MHEQKNKQQINSIKSLTPLCLSSAAVLSNSGVAKAVNFNFTYAPSVTVEQIVSMETAGKIWSDYLADNIAVNVHINSTNQLSNDVVGDVLPGILNWVNYSDFRSGLNANIFSTYDTAAYNNLSLVDQNGVNNFDD